MAKRAQQKSLNTVTSSVKIIDERKERVINPLLLKEYEVCYLQYTKIYLEKHYTLDINQLDRCSEILEFALVNNTIDRESVDRVKDIIKKTGIKGFDLFFVYTDVQGSLLHIVSLCHPEYSMEEAMMIVDKAYAELIYGTKK